MNKPMNKPAPDAGVRVHALKAPGLPCPVCNTPIVVDPMLLLSAAPIQCAACGLELTLNTEKSASTLNALGAYMNNFNEVQSNFANKVDGMTGGKGRAAEKPPSRGRRVPRRRARRGES